MALILANTYAPIRHCHVIIFLYLTHEILTLIFLFSHHHHVGSSSRRPSTVNHLVVDTTHHHHHTFSSLQQPIRPRQPPSSLLQICANSIAAEVPPHLAAPQICIFMLPPPLTREKTMAALQQQFVHRKTSIVATRT